MIKNKRMHKIRLWLMVIMKKEKAVKCLPCPFCGGLPTAVTWMGKTYISCETCEIGPETIAYASADKAIKIWNTRHADDSSSPDLIPGVVDERK